MSRLLVEVEKVNDILKFKTNNTQGNLKVYYSTNTEMKDERLLLVSDDCEFEVEAPTNVSRIFFRVKQGENTSNIFSTRLINANSIDNFRDLGGYKTVDGRTVKWGCFYRTASLSSVSLEDKILLENMKIKTIFDLRSKMEVLSGKDVELNGCKYINESGIVTLDDRNITKDKHYIKEENFDMHKMIMELLKNQDKIKEVGEFFLDGYKKMIQHNEAFKILFDTLKSEERLPLIFHCTSGKDRTGVAGALILLALGVDEKTVIEDYCLSNKYREEVNNKQIDKIKEYVKDAKLLEICRAFFEVKEEYLMIALNYIKKEYSSYEEYIIEGLKVTREELQTFRDKYLE